MSVSLNFQEKENTKKIVDLFFEVVISSYTYRRLIKSRGKGDSPYRLRRFRKIQLPSAPRMNPEQQCGQSPDKMRQYDRILQPPEKSLLGVFRCDGGFTHLKKISFFVVMLFRRYGALFSVWYHVYIPRQLYRFFGADRLFRNGRLLIYSFTQR